MLKIKNLSFGYNKNHVLNQINFNLSAGETVSIVGPSGEGKTTLLKCLTGLLRPKSDFIMSLDEKNLEGLSVEDRPLTMMFQEPRLFPHMTLYQNVAFPLKSPKFKHLSKVEIREKVMLSLFDVGLKDFSERYPHQISGGQAQRVAIARAFVSHPKIILLDEPFSALNRELKSDLNQMLEKKCKERGLFLIKVSHDIEDSLEYSDNILFLNNGEVLQFDSPQGMISHPKGPQVLKFFNSGVQVDKDHYFLFKDCSFNAQTTGALECQVLNSRVSLNGYKSALRIINYNKVFTYKSLTPLGADKVYLNINIKKFPNI